MIRAPSGMEGGVCGTIDFPDTLNQPWANEFLALHDMDIDARGRGEIIGEARTDREINPSYVYATRDGGATWGAPRQISRPREARRGLYSEVEDTSPPEALLAELTRYAEGR